MAISYSNLFTSLGKLIKYYNGFATTAQALPTSVAAIETVFAAENQLDSISGLNPGNLLAWEGEYTNRRGQLVTYAKARFADPGLIDELNSPSSDLATVMRLFIERMITDSQTLNAGVGSIGTVTAGAANVGNGTVLATLLLDRVTSPGSRQGVTMPAHHNYGDVLSELVIAETMAFRVVADSFKDGLAEGAETIQWTGDLPDASQGVLTLEGSGSIGSFAGIHGDTGRYLQNADFETWTVTNTPDNWTIAAGAVTTNIVQASGSNAYHGTYGLEMLGSGAAAITITQAMTAAQVTAGKRYCFTCRIKASASVSAGDLTIVFTGTGYSAGAAEKITIAHGSLPTSWTLYSFFVLMPLTIPSDFKLSISWASTPTTAKTLFIDDIGFGPVQYGGGLGVVAVRGATPFVRDDRFTSAITITEGVIQKFFRRGLGVQLPSDNSAAETILDSLAT